MYQITYPDNSISTFKENEITECNGFDVVLVTRVRKMCRNQVINHRSEGEKLKIKKL